jgi:hypothetical protein
MSSIKIPTLLALGLLLLLTSACQAKDVCPDGSVTYATDPSLLPALALPTAIPVPSMAKVAGKMMAVDRVITGPVCNDVWSKTIYVACDIQLVQWKDENTPNFFKNCNLTIEPETVVYVAAHNDAAYYNGCSCHTGGEAE